MSEAPWGGSEELWAGAASAALGAGWQVVALLPAFKEPHPKRTALERSGVEMLSWSRSDLARWNGPAAANGPSAPTKNPYQSLVHPRPDLLIISHGGLMDMVNGHAGMLSDLWSSGVPYVVIIQANTEGYWPSDIQRRFMQVYFGSALQVVFVSRQNLEFARRQLADPLGNAVVWQQPVNLESQKSVKWPSGRTLNLASVARLDFACKGQDLLIDVLSSPAWRARDWKLNIYGTGPNAALIRESAALGGIADRVELHGHVTDVAQIWRANHVLVMPSRVEGTPLALLEALCCGRPVVATDVGGSADWLIDGETGFVAEAPRAANLSSALESMWERRSGLQQMGEAAARFFATSFHPNPGGQLFRHLVGKLSERPRAQAPALTRPLLSVVRIALKNAVESHVAPIPGVEWITVAAESVQANTSGDELRLIRLPQSNPAIAANAGVGAARGPHVLLAEATADLPEAHVRSIVEALKGDNGGFYYCSDASARKSDAPGLCVFPRSAWLACGGFPAGAQSSYLDWFWKNLGSLGHHPAPLPREPRRLSPGKNSGLPRVSVVVTCYNYGPYLERCIDSVLGQEFDDLEIIIVNDGSTDTTPLVADWIRSLNPGKIRVLHQANSGQPAISRNNGIRCARGELILPLDADDWIAPSMVRECVAALDQDASVGVAYTDTFYCHDGGKVELHPAGEFSVQSLRQSNCLSCCSMFRKAVWDRLGGYRTNVRGYEDWDFWLASAAAGFQGRRIAKPLFLYRVKDRGVFSETVAQDKIRRAHIVLNNPTCYSKEERTAAETLIVEAGKPKVAPTPSATVDTLRRQASERFQAEDWKGCIDACSRALEQAPSDFDLLFVLANALIKDGQAGPAAGILDRAILAKPEATFLRELRACLGSVDGRPAAPKLVSVVIPCYQQAQYLREAVESVLAQTYAAHEIIIVNDGSTDDTSFVAKALILEKEGRAIRLVEKENGGLSDARNAGIRIARGAYVLPLDADDRIHPEFLSKTVALLDREPKVGIAYTDWVYFGAHATPRSAIDYDFNRLCTKENLFTCTSLYRREAWDAAGGYHTNMTRGLEDWDFWIGCGKKGFVGKRIPEPLFHYRAKVGSMIEQVQPFVKVMFAQIVANHPDVYDAASVAAAAKTIAGANLPGPKKSSCGVEWIRGERSLGAFNAAVARAEDAVRALAFSDALSHIDAALRAAPDAASGLRAAEIARLLNAARTAPPSTAATSEGEFFTSGEIGAIRQLVAAYADAPEKKANREQLGALRKGLVEFILGSEPSKLEVLFKGGLGEVYGLVRKSGVLSETPGDEFTALLRTVDGALARIPRSEAAVDVRPVLAGMLCFPAHRAASFVHPDRIPGWLREDYVGYLIQPPEVFGAAGEAELFAEHMTGVVRWIHEQVRRAPAAAVSREVAGYFAAKANFIPLYSSARNIRDLAKRRAAILEYVLDRNGAMIDYEPPQRPRFAKRIKVGFVASHFGHQTETYVTLPALQLDRNRFEVCLFAVAENPGPVEAACRSHADSFVGLPKNLHEQVRCIRDANLDVAVICSNVTAVTNQVALVALHRLAPLQLATYCSPVSTGMRHIDGFLTGRLMDVPHLQDHFTETLRFCDGPPGCLDYRVEGRAGSMAFSREGLGFPRDAVVFVNAAACFKILPETIETWATVLASVPNSRLLLLPFNPNWANAFPARQFERTVSEIFRRHGLGRDRFVLSKPLPSRADVKALLKLADIYLDTAPFSGSIALIDPLEIGLPTVVQSGVTHRGMMAAALLRELGIPDLVTEDRNAYAALATRLAGDGALRGKFRDRIASAMANGPKFINPQAYAAELGELLESLVAREGAAVLAAGTA